MPAKMHAMTPEVQRGIEHLLQATESFPTEARRKQLFDHCRALIGNQITSDITVINSLINLLIPNEPN